MQLLDRLNDPHLNSKDLREIVENISEVSVNWAGSRTLAVQGYVGTVTLDEIATKVLESSSQKGLQSREKLDLIACETALISCYELADTKWQASNPLTYSIGYISRLAFEGYGNSFSPNFASIKWRIIDHEVRENLKITH